MEILSYTYNIYDLVGNIGVVILIGAFMALQAQYLDSQDYKYSLLNLIAAILLGISLLDKTNISSLVIEFFWGVISIYGLIKALKTHSKS